MLPSRSWAAYEADLRCIGEHRSLQAQTDLSFLAAVGLVQVAPPALTSLGQRYFTLRFIEGQEAAATEVLQDCVIKRCPEAAAICQLLANRPKVSRQVAETVLRNQGYGSQLNDRRLGSLLALMGRVEAIEYSKRDGAFRVLARPLLDDELPRSMFVAPETPWSNRRWLLRVLGECRGFLYWLDKHFLPGGLEFIGEAVDGEQISTVHVVSLPLEENLSRKTRRAYADLVKELRGRGVSFEWRFLPSTEFRDTHDRWLISEHRAWNVPNLNAILSGQHCELVETQNQQRLTHMFERIWTKASSTAC